jgi:YHS domain-containing protein
MAAVAVLVGAFVVAEEAKKDEFVAKCVVAGVAVKADKNADYKGVKVNFCCDNCKAKFAAEPAKYQVAANIQIVGTKQFKQEKCPLSGGKLNPDTAIDVAGVKVAFCCENCQGKVAAAKGDAQKELVFKDEPFTKAFVIAKKDK